MKKAVCLLAALALVAALLTAGALAAEPLTMTVSSATDAAAGEQVTLSVALTSNPGLATLDMSIGYDTGALELVSMAFNTGFTTGGMPAVNEAGKQMTFVKLDGTSYTGEIATLTFKVLAGGASQVTVTINDCLDVEENAVPLRSATAQGTVGTAAPCQHDWGSGVVTTEPGCETKGVRTYICGNNSSHTKTEDIDPLGHDYADSATFTWTEDAANATWTATYRVECEADNCDHAATGNAVITVSSSTAQNCQQTGTTTYTASVTLDGRTYTEDKVITGAAGPHDWDEGTVTTQPTCTDKGVRTYTCELDSSHTKTEDVEELGHCFDSKTVAGQDTYGHWYGCDNGDCIAVSAPEDHEEGTAATCMSGALCGVCGEELGEPDSDAHQWNEGEVTQPANCITGATGIMHYVCELNDEHTKDEDIPAEHTWDDGEITREPTTTQEGECTYHCTVDGCDGTKTEPIAKLTPSGSGSGNAAGGEVAKTGDEARPGLWLALLMAAGAVTAGILAMGRKKEH